MGKLTKEGWIDPPVSTGPEWEPTGGKGSTEITGEAQKILESSGFSVTGSNLTRMAKILERTRRVQVAMNIQIGAESWDK